MECQAPDSSDERRKRDGMRFRIQPLRHRSQSFFDRRSELNGSCTRAARLPRPSASVDPPSIGASFHSSRRSRRHRGRSSSRLTSSSDSPRHDAGPAGPGLSRPLAAGHREFHPRSCSGFAKRTRQGELLARLPALSTPSVCRRLRAVSNGGRRPSDPFSSAQVGSRPAALASRPSSGRGNVSREVRGSSAGGLRDLDPQSCWDGRARNPGSSGALRPSAARARRGACRFGASPPSARRAGSRPRAAPSGRGVGKRPGRRPSRIGETGCRSRARAPAPLGQPGRGGADARRQSRLLRRAHQAGASRRSPRQADPDSCRRARALARQECNAVPAMSGGCRSVDSLRSGPAWASRSRIGHLRRGRYWPPGEGDASAHRPSVRSTARRIQALTVIPSAAASRLISSMVSARGLTETSPCRRSVAAASGGACGRLAIRRLVVVFEGRRVVHARHAGVAYVTVSSISSPTASATSWRRSRPTPE